MTSDGPGWSRMIRNIDKSLHRVPVVSGSVTISTTSVVHFAIFDKPVDFRLNRLLAVVRKSSRANAYINGFITSVEFANILINIRYSLIVRTCDPFLFTMNNYLTEWTYFVQCTIIDLLIRGHNQIKCDHLIR